MISYLSTRTKILMALCLCGSLVFPIELSSAFSASAKSPPAKKQGAPKAMAKPLAPMEDKTSESHLNAAVIYQANTKAAEEDYAGAIALYEGEFKKIDREHPQYEKLRDNLAVLYFNRGVQLQKEKQYEAASQLFQKILALRPEDPHAKEGIAANNYHQAMDLVESGSQDYATMHRLLDDAIRLSPKEQAFPRRKAYLWMQEAQMIADKQDWDGAAQLIEKALAIEPESENLKTSLANIYLQKARGLKGNEKQTYIDKALALDNSPTMQQLAGQVKKEGAFISRMKPSGQPTEAMNHRFLNGPTTPTGGMTSTSERTATQLSISQMIDAIEENLNIALDKNQGGSLLTRLEVAEKQVYGLPQTGPLTVRTRNLYATLMGGTSGETVIQEDQLQGEMKALANVPEQSYIEPLLQVTDGKVIRWGRFPLRVYIDVPNPKDEKKLPKGFQSTYEQDVKEAFEAWKTATQGFFTYVQIKNPEAADIRVFWSDTYDDKYKATDARPNGQDYKNLTVPKPNNLVRLLNMASMFTPGMFYLAPQAAAAALQFRELKHIQALIDQGKIELGTADTMNMPEPEAHTYVKNMAMKEIGHVLGLKYSSPEARDITNPVIPKESAKMPSTRDLVTLKELYSRPATIVLNVR